jgi:hypothetical protein
MPNVPNFFAPWTYDEILITVPAQHPYRLDLLRMRCPLGGDDGPCEGNQS